MQSSRIFGTARCGNAEVIFMAETIFSTSRSTALRHVSPTGDPVIFR
jgi:hypothetical protein